MQTDRTHVSEWTLSERPTDRRQCLLPAEAEWTSILWEKDDGRKETAGDKGVCERLLDKKSLNPFDDIYWN